MKVLFVCRGNVGRSQMAQVLFEKLSGLKSFSVGTKVNFEGQKIGEIELAKLVVDSMKKHGLDVSGNIVRQLKPEMVSKFDKII
ncbi:MAG: low molecular weight phosphatase family protein, partial [Nanoarchaeota archaeon]